MAESKHAAAESAERQLVVTRIFEAPRDLVFKAWTERERALRWWGPQGFTVPFLELAARPGEAWRARMRSPEGKAYSQHGILRELDEPERLVFTSFWDDDPGGEMLVTVLLMARGRKTEMVFRKGPFQSVESRDAEEEGWSESFDRLDDYLASVRDEQVAANAA